jgi:hypothetical protein
MSAAPLHWPATAWVRCGDFELNLAADCGPPTLRPAPALEKRLIAPSATTTGTNNSPLPTLGVHLHAFYLKECEQILGCLARSGTSFDLLITTDCSSKQAAIQQQLARLEAPPWQQRRLEVRVVANRGRNVAPLLRDGLAFLEPCTLALHVHTKRSLHSDIGAAWFAATINQLIGSATSLQAAQALFAANPQLGLALPLPAETIRPYLNWGRNFEMAALLVQAGWPDRRLDPRAALVFPAGMMFWFRPPAIAPLAALLRQAEPLPVEPLPIDGSSLHALERLTLHACEEAGWQWAFLPPTAGTAEAAQPASLSVWPSQPEPYLEGVAALAARQRELAGALERRAQEQAALEQQLATTAAALDACQQASRQEQQALMQEQARLLTRLQAREQELVALRQSLSWRLSAPLRRLGRLLRQR